MPARAPRWFGAGRGAFLAGWRGMARDGAGWRGMARDGAGWRGLEWEGAGWRGMARDGAGWRVNPRLRACGPRRPPARPGFWWVSYVAWLWGRGYTQVHHTVDNGCEREDAAGRGRGIPPCGVEYLGSPAIARGGCRITCSSRH